MSTVGGEFDFIARHLSPLATDHSALNLKDDVALLGAEWVISKDMLVAGVHFRRDDPADMIARKALRVNLSDLAGKGAKPFGYFLGCAFPAICDETWRARFVAGLSEDQAEYGLSLLGGDTVSTPGPITLSVTMIGKVPARVPLRCNAQAGDVIWVSGSLGDAALGLDKAAARSLQDRYFLPQPRLALGQALQDLVNASMDISDGLLADAHHIAAASNKSLALDLSALPLSIDAQEAVGNDPSLWQKIVSGGDDYELLFTASADKTDEIILAARQASTLVTQIGVVEEGAGLRLHGAPLEYIDPAITGFQHF